ncbi:MAG TPA: dethiobiotin synthase [Nevskiaceae bacterium]|nr:dethiobiotin synthase [Nevskiaceae bacterium]
MSPATARTLFVTGTDTSVGKTHAACALLARARREGVRACGYKPVAAGGVRDNGQVRNEDVLALQHAAGTREPYAAINTYTFERAIAPHLAARAEHARVQVTRLHDAHAQLAQRHELVVVEGAGGWQVPLNDDLTFAGWVAQQGWPVLLVVGMRLGCLNHALLSVESIARRTRLLGWIANVLPPEQEALADNIETLRALVPAPLYGVLPARGGIEAAADALDFSALWTALTRRDEIEDDEPQGV